MQAHNLTTFMGGNAALQPGSLQEMMLHEAAVAWIRRGLTWSLPTKPWEETIEAFGARLKGVAQKVNAEYNVEGLCKQLPQRVQDPHGAEGGRLGK